MKRYSKKEKKTRGKRIKSRKVAKGRKVKSRKNNRIRKTRTRKNRTRKVGGGIEKEPVMSLSSVFGFPASREPMVVGQAQPKPQKFSKKRKRSNDPDPDLRGIDLLPTPGEKLSLFDHLRNSNPQPRPKIGFVEPDKGAEPLDAWPEVNEELNIPVITPLGPRDYDVQQTKKRRGLIEGNKGSIPVFYEPRVPNIVTVHGPEGNLYSHVLSDTPHNILEEEYRSYLRTI